MGRYYILDSDGEDTNLQLYAFRQAKRYWEELVYEYREYGDETDYLTERCAFVLATMGLSISQLLGQNNPEPGDSVPSPRKLFRAIVRTHGLDERMIYEFERFTYYYDGCRHFGKTGSGQSHRKIDQLTFGVAQECYEFGLTIWRTMLRIYRKEPGSDLDALDIDNLSIDPDDYYEG